MGNVGSEGSFSNGTVSICDQERVTGSGGNGYGRGLVFVREFV